MHRYISKEDSLLIAQCFFSFKREERALKYLIVRGWEHVCFADAFDDYVNKVDLVACKNNKKYLIQVKSSQDYFTSKELSTFKSYCKQEKAKAMVVVVCYKQIFMRYV
jgi:Holliday junction resolvase